MSVFILTAKHDMHIAQGNDIKRGDSFEVFVGKSISEVNLLNNPDARMSIIRQLANHDINLTVNRKEFFLNNGHFQVEKRKNVLANHC